MTAVRSNNNRRRWKSEHKVWSFKSAAPKLVLTIVDGLFVVFSSILPLSEKLDTINYFPFKDITQFFFQSKTGPFLRPSKKKFMYNVSFLVLLNNTVRDSQ